MEGSEDEENAGLDTTAFEGEYGDSEGDADVLGRRRTHGQSPERSEKSSWSGGSRAAGCERVDASLEDQTGTSQASLHSNGMLSYHPFHHHYHRGPGRLESNSQEDFDFDQSSEGESQRGRGLSSEEGVTDDENREETVIETSCDETSFNTSVCSYKETGSSSELSVDPVVWKKFKFLSSILKETQHNLRAMDDLILEHHRLQTQPAALLHPSHTLHQGLGEGEAKTDEAKLEEILSLLHHLTHTLSSYEQHPLLASTPHLQVISTSLHPDSPTHQQAQRSYKAEGNGREATVALCHPSPLENPGTTDHTIQPCPSLPPLSQPLIPSKTARFTESCEGRSVSFTTPGAEATYSGFPPTFQVSPDSTDARLLRETHQGASEDTHPHISSHYLSSSRNIDNLSPLPVLSELSKVLKKDTVSQTDPLLLVPRISEEHQPPHNVFTSKSYPPESLHGHQEVLHHPLMKETRSLRKDIDDIVARKQALDSRLQSLIAHRAMQRELEATDFDEPRRRLTPLTKSKSLEDGELHRPKSKHRKYKSRSKSYEEEGQVRQVRKRNGTQESYLSMINENHDEFPSLTMESLDNGDKITELQTDEADMPGLGDSGLSSEINSINATIQELVKENQQLHKYLQGMTCESLLKVDQEKLALEARLQSLDKENKSLKISLDEEEELAHSKAKVSKGVKFSIDEESEEQECDRETKEPRRSKVKDSSEYDSISETLTVSTKSESAPQKPSVSGSEPLRTPREGEEEAAQYSPHNTVSHLRSEIERLTKQNQQLVNIIEKERSVGSGQRDSPRLLKSQSTNEEVSVPSVGESLTDHSNVTREVEKLQQKIKKLVEEKEILEFKLSREVSERDFESTRLEARIQILSDQKQTLMQKLQDSDNMSKAKMEMSCQTDTVGLKSNGTMLECDVESGQLEGTSSEKQNKTSTLTVGQYSTAQHIHCSPDKLTATTTSKVSPPVSANITLSSVTARKTEEYLEKGSGRHHTATASEDSLSSRPHLKDLPLSMLSSDENISTDDDKISLIRTPREDTHNGNFSEAPVSVTEPSIFPGDIHLTSDVVGRKGNGATGMESVSHSKEDLVIDGSEQGSQVQLEALVAQNKVIATSLSELKSLSKTSESGREALFIRIMEENVKVMQNIGEKLASAGLPASSTEPDSRLTELSNENQELKTTLQQQQKRIEILINQNSSLEKKLHMVQQEHKERRGEGDARNTSSSDSYHQDDDDTLSTIETKGQKGRKVSKEGLSDASVNSLSSGKQRESMDTSKVSVIEKKQSLKPLNTDQALSSVHGGQGGGSRAVSLLPDQAGSSKGQMEGSQQSDSSESSRKESPGSAREKRRKSSTVLDPETQRLIDCAVRREKENRIHLLEEAEREKEAMQERIMTLVQENDTLAARLQEVVSVSRNLSGHMNSVKDQLERVEAEKDDLHRKVRSLEDGREDSSLSLSDSIGSSRLTQRLKERIRSLQGEVERGWQEAHQHTVERDKAMAEKESLEYTSSIAINTARKEAESLREQVAALQEDRERRSLEQTNLQNELERKSVMARAAQETQASHLERLVEAERRISSLQNDLKRLEEQLAKETLARKSAETELEEVKARRKSLSSSCEAEGERMALGGEKQWTSTIAHLRSQLQQEQLRIRLLEAGEQESSVRVLSLQRDVRGTLEANQQLQDKYNQLRAAYKVKRAEKTSHHKLSQHYTTQVKELGKTSAALEESFKVMLSALGESIEVTVELFASHVFLTPCLTHPGPAIHQDPEAWFGAQQGRLRWLQNQLRKLCLHNWKTGNLPKTSNLDASHFDVFLNESQISPATRSQVKRGEQRAAGRASKTRQSEGRVDVLSELSILDENRSYTSTPVRRSSASDISLSTAFSPTKFGGEAKHSTLKPLPKFGEAKISVMTPGVHQSSMYLSEAECILMSQQKELSEVKHRQYKAIIHSLQQEIDQSMASSPSVPSSMFTTPERKVMKYSQDLLEEEEDHDSLSSEMSLIEVHCSQAMSPTSDSPSAAESSTSTHSPSRNSVKNVAHTPKEAQGSQSSPEKKFSPEYMISPKTKDDSQIYPQEQENGVSTKQSSRSSSRCSVIKSSPEEGIIGGKEEDVKQVRSSSLKEDEQSRGLDVDKDRDSWEQEEVEDDLIRTLVYSES